MKNSAIRHIINNPLLSIYMLQEQHQYELLSSFQNDDYRFFDEENYRKPRKRLRMF